MTDDEIRNLDIMNIPDDNPTGYILEVDLEYPHNLHKLHNDYPLAPEKNHIDRRNAISLFKIISRQTRVSARPRA